MMTTTDTSRDDVAAEAEEGGSASELSATEIIDRIGGTSAAANLCGVTMPSVSEWRIRGIPRGWEMFFRAMFPRMFATDYGPDDQAEIQSKIKASRAKRA